MIGVVVGPNSFAAREYLNSEVADFKKTYGDFSVERIDAQDSEPEQIVRAVQETSFLAPEKLIVISNISAQKEITEEFEKFSEKISEGNKVLIYEPKPDKRSTFYKELKKQKDFREFSELDENGLRQWLSGIAAQENVKINPADVTYLINRVGNNQEKLKNEFEKLIRFNKNITRESIDILTDATPQSSVFNLLDVAFSADHKRTIMLYEDQRAQGVEPLNILSMIIWQIHNIALVNSAGDKSPDEISSASGMSPFVVKKSQLISNRLGRGRIESIIQKLSDIDLFFKTVTIDQDTAMKNLLVYLAKA